VNNLRDIATDRTAGKTTTAVIFGANGTRAWFTILLVAAYAVAVGTWLVEPASPAVLAVALSLPFAWSPARAVLGGTEGRALNVALKATARFHLVFGVLFAAGLAIR